MEVDKKHVDPSPLLNLVYSLYTDKIILLVS
jgi:hypothetical protein